MSNPRLRAPRCLFAIFCLAMAASPMHAQTLVSEATGPDSSYSYGIFNLDGRNSQVPAGSIIAYQWRQIEGSPVTIFFPTRSYTQVLARQAETLKFELSVRDTSNTLPPAFDTLVVTVREPVGVAQFLEALHRYPKVQDGLIQMSVTTEGAMLSFASADSILELGGTVSDEAGAFGTLTWYAPGRSGSFRPKSTDWSGLRINLDPGDNLLTLVYAKKGFISVERRLVTWTPSVAFGLLSLSPDVIWAGESRSYTTSMFLSGTGITSATLVRIASGEAEVGPMLDDGVAPDVKAGDKSSTLGFGLNPSEKETIRFRVKVVQNGSVFFSPAYLFTAQKAYEQSIWESITSVNAQAVNRYFAWKAQFGQVSALSRTANWLSRQANVASSAPGPGGKSVCWQYANGVMAYIDDAPTNTKAGYRKIKTKGISPYYDEFQADDDGAMTYEPILMKQNPVAYSVDSLLKNDLANPSRITLEDFKKLGGAKALVVSSHGNTFGYKSLRSARFNPIMDVGQQCVSNWANPFLCVLTGVAATPAILQTYHAAFTSPGPFPELIIHATQNGDVVAATPAFFLRHTEKIDGGLVYLSTCRSLFNNGLWDVFKSKGAATMIGYSDYVAVDFAGKSGKIIFSNLTSGRTLQDGVDSVLDFCGKPNNNICQVLSTGEAADLSSPPAKLKVMGDPTFTLIPTKLWSWGVDYGRLGSGTSGTGPTPLPILAKQTGILKVASGTAQSLLLGPDSSVWTWGDGFLGSLGHGDEVTKTAPDRISSLGKAIDVFAGVYHSSFALLADSSLWAWGEDNAGKLGTGGSGSSGFSAIPKEVVGNAKWTSVASGGQHTLAIAKDSSLWVWGDDWIGQMGDGPVNGSASYPVHLPYIHKASAVAATAWNSYALKPDGTVWAWGANFGCGKGNRESHCTSPVQILSGVKAIVAGYTYAAVIKADSSVWIWGGYSEYDPDVIWSPKKVAGLKSVVSIGFGDYHLVAGKADGTVFAYGENTYGQLGNGANTAEWTGPTGWPAASRVKTLKKTFTVSAGGSTSHALE